MSKAWVVHIALAVSAMLGPGVARAAGHTCQLADSGVLEIDGMIDEWRGFAPFRTGPAGDAEVTLRCAFDERALYLSVDVVDDKLIRTRQPRAAGEDSVTVSLAADSASARLRFRVFPGAPTGKRKLDGVPRWVKVEDSLTERGYAIEIMVPLRKLAGFGRSTPAVLAEVLVHDADLATEMAIQDSVGLRGRLHLSSHLPAYKGFLAATRLSARELTLDRLVDVDAAPGTERVVRGGRFVGVLSDGFAFFEIPATSTADVLEVKLIDPSASGRPMIMTHSRQVGDNGSRELLIFWRVDSAGQFARVLALEVAQDLGGRTIANRWELVPAGSARAMKERPRSGALDLVVEVGPVSGWDAATYERVAASTDVTPVLTPFGGQTAAVYWFDGDAALGPEPLVESGRSRRTR